MKREVLESLARITEEEQEILSGSREINKNLYMSVDSTVVDSKKLLDTGKLIQVRPHTRFIHFPKHIHNYVEVIYMCSGKTTHIVNDDKLELQQGELLFLSQKAEQEIFPAGEEDIAINFIILPEFFDQALSMIGGEDNLVHNFITGCLRNDIEDVGYIHFKVSEVLPIQNLVENLIWTLMNNQHNKRSINQITMGLLFLQLMNYTDKAAVGRKNSEQELLLSVFRYIEERYKDGELTELANILGYDSAWLSKQIKKLSGKNYIELVQGKRLVQAQFLLLNTNMSVADIGLAIGYDNLSYFHKIFRKNLQMSPKHWRDLNRR